MSFVQPPLLLMGGTSLIGRSLLARLGSEGRTFVALSRSPQPPVSGGNWLVGDLGGELALPAAEQALSLSPIWLLPPALPRLLAAGVRRIVAFSSTSVWTKAASPDPDERAVAQRLARAEAEMVEFCEAHGVAWTVLRPTLIYAEGRDANVSRLAGLIRRWGVLPLYGAGEGRRQPVHADDLAVGALAALEAPAAINRSFDLPGGETLTYREMSRRIFLALKRRPRIVSLPPFLWNAGFRLASPWLPGAGATMGARMAEDLVFDPRPAQAAFGWNPRPFRPTFA